MKWATPPLNREQHYFFSPTLENLLDQEHPVRAFDAIFSQLDWSVFEAAYVSNSGQPAIHPRAVAGALLYGLQTGIRSTRKLEEATRLRLDFLWLLSGQAIDHSTFSKFRTKFGEELKEVFRQINLLAMEQGLIQLTTVAFDGTRVKANNARFRAATGESLQRRLAEIDAEFERMMSELDQGGVKEDLEEKIRLLEAGRAELEENVARAAELDEQRRKAGMKNPGQVPLTDPDSRVMPNKEGGYAPNYTPLATTDSFAGFIVAMDVISEVNEASQLVPAMDQIHEIFGRFPEQSLADAGNNSGEAMAGMEERGVEFYAPASPSGPQEGNPARREDPRNNPVPAELAGSMPVNNRKQLDKTNFIYDAEADQYICPQGRSLPNHGKKSATQYRYRSPDCSGCPLASLCLGAGNRGTRTITRDVYEEARERTAKRMASEVGRQLSNQRPRIAETTFGIIKAIMGVRQFLLRGLPKVQIEWRWIATAFNLAKLARFTAAARTER
jgi:transposase